MCPREIGPSCHLGWDMDAKVMRRSGRPSSNCMEDQRAELHLTRRNATFVRTTPGTSHAHPGQVPSLPHPPRKPSPGES